MQFVIRRKYNDNGGGGGNLKDTLCQASLSEMFFVFCLLCQCPCHRVNLIVCILKYQILFIFQFCVAFQGQRTVYRLTLVKSWNDEEIQSYASLVKLGRPDFIEVKVRIISIPSRCLALVWVYISIDTIWCFALVWVYISIDTSHLMLWRWHFLSISLFWFLVKVYNEPLNQVHCSVE